MGLMMRDDPPKVIDLVNRQFGFPVEGLALSIKELEKEDPDQLPGLSVVLRNVGQTSVKLTVPGWIFFYEVTAIGQDGTQVPLSPFGGELLKPERRTESIPLTLAPGEVHDNELPVGSLLAFKKGRRYSIGVACEVPGGARLQSNEISLRA